MLAAAIVLAAANLVAQNLKGDFYLDIPGHTYSPVTPAAPYVPHFNGIGATSHPKYVTSLKLTLLSVDVSDFVYGDYFTYEVLVENTGSAPVILPWSPNKGAFARPVQYIPAGFRTGSLHLQVESAGSADWLAMLDGQSLLGSNEVPGSLLELAPGRTARVRVPAQWSATMPEGRAAVLRQPDGEVRVRAVFSVTPAAGDGSRAIGTADYVPLTRSSNTIKVRVMPRELR
ncbi:MAG: hypothetical protein ACRD3G_23760 [Vicinamibacterales bacterium]